MVVRQFYPWVGGTERQAQKLAARLIALGIDVRVVTGWWRWGTRRREEVDGISVFRNFTFWGFFGLKGLRKFGGYIYLIHVHLLNYHAFPCVIAGRRFGKRTIIKIANSGKGSDIADMRANHMLPGERKMLPTILGADRMVAINRAIIDELAAAGVPGERIVVIPNGVETEAAAPKSDYAAGDPVRVVFVGRLHPQKGLDVLLEAFRAVLESAPERRWRLSVLGDGPLRARLEAQAERLGLGGAVEFCGAVGDVPARLLSSDIFVLPSQAEGMSNALLEAMAHGLPVVATRVSGNVDLIEDGVNGLLVAPGEPAELARALRRLGDDGELRARLGRAARAAIEAGFSMTAVAAEYLRLYRALHAEAARPSRESPTFSGVVPKV
jgi:glycosyltransferase involved in cell wall biosynthesis